MFPSVLQFTPLQRVHAEAIVQWRYPRPFEIYNTPIARRESAVNDLLRPEYHYHAVLDDRGVLIAYCCFGADARVAGGDYSADALDLGTGLRPDLTGKGLGRRVIAAAMSLGIGTFRPARFRVTIASFNQRAKRTCRILGFHHEHRFPRPSDGLKFDIFMRDAKPPSLSVPFVERESLGQDTMKHLSSEADQQFRRDFESLVFPKTEFRHREHLRLAYAYLTEGDAEDAHERMRAALHAFIAHHGIDPAKDNETITKAWILAVRHFMEKTPGPSCFDDLIRANPVVLDAKIMLTHYTSERLNSPEARASFVEPDRDPIPRYGR